MQICHILWNVHIISSCTTRCRVLCLCVPVGQNFEPIETPFALWTSVGPGNCVRCIINTTCVHGDAALRLITLTSCFHWKWLLSWCLCECRQLSNTVMTKSYERQCVITNHQCHPAWYRCWWHWLRIRMHLILSGFPWVNERSWKMVFKNFCPDKSLIVHEKVLILDQWSWKMKSASG